MRNKLLALLASSVLLSSPAIALDADDFFGLEGYSVSIVTKVDGDFEGCEYDKKIKLQAGVSLTCNEYKYHYSYAPSVVVLARDIGRAYSVKVIIDDDIYDMQPVAKK